MNSKEILPEYLIVEEHVYENYIYKVYHKYLQAQYEIETRVRVNPRPDDGEFVSIYRLKEGLQPNP